MNDTRERHYRALFWVAAIYDIILGFVFLFTPQLAEQLGFADELPSYGGYISLLAAFVFVIGIAYAYIARGDLHRNRDLIAIGALYKHLIDLSRVKNLRQIRGRDGLVRGWSDSGRGVVSW